MKAFMTSPEVTLSHQYTVKYSGREMEMDAIRKKLLIQFCKV